MPGDWYYTVNGQQAPAPVPSGQLKQLAATGQLQPTDLVWQEGMANWVPASSIKGLFPSSRPSSAERTPPEGKPALRPREREAEAPPEEQGGLLGLHPVVVGLVSLCTGGLFGLVYAYLVCSRFAAQANRRAADSAGRPLGRARHPLAVLLLSYLTLGLYQCWWVYRVLAECNAYMGQDGRDARTELALMLIFPPYAAYLAVVRVPQRLRAAAAQAKLADAPAAEPLYLFLLPCLLPALPWLSMAQQDQLNHLWEAAP